MKSLLVDAIRRANSDEPDQTLSDSGSFETDGNDFGTTANDAVANVEAGSNADELQLYETSVALAVGEIDFEEATAADIERAAIDLADSEFSGDRYGSPVATASPSCNVRRASLLARYSPHLCVLLALTAAAGWTLFQQLQAAANGGTLGLLRQTSERQEQPAAIGMDGSKFRFVDAPPVDNQERVE